MIYGRDILVFRRVVREIQDECVQLFWNNADDPLAGVFENICHWCLNQLALITESGVENYLFSTAKIDNLNKIIYEAYYSPWVYFDGYLEVDDFIQSCDDSSYQNQKPQVPSLQIFYQILSILKQEETALQIKEEVNALFYEDIC